MYTHQEFLDYREQVTDIHPGLLNLYNKYKTNNWRNTNQPTNWLLNKKLNQNEDDKLYSQFTSLLNKLSESNINDLTQELQSFNIVKKEQLNKLAELILNKAILEKKFNNIYAKLTKQLSNYNVKDNDETIYLKTLVINKCQNMFNNTISESPQLKLNKDMCNGCLRFIGELYNIDMLTVKVINTCIIILVQKINTTIKSEFIEYLCTLIKTCGKYFCKRSKQDGIVVFNKIDSILSEKKLENRDKFSLMDIIDMKNNEKWLV